ncbi:MAG: AtpZ/AtpI family protein [Gracilibacteraceae bacterium]|jgi:F0F1-type ATP synthase assembly protein I|nr:AtpZ/AtpI family protein [Gracilibacteraceae bacterium]
MTEKEKKTGSWLRYAAVGSSISCTLAGCVAGGYFLGAFLDRRLATAPLFTVMLIIGGVALGISYLVWTLTRISAASGKRGDHES